MSKIKYVRTTVVLVQLAEDDPTSVDAQVLCVNDRQVFYALQRHCDRMQREFSAALRAYRKKGLRFSLGEDLPLPLPSADCNND